MKDVLHTQKLIKSL